jgi:hypothetical protein
LLLIMFTWFRRNAAFVGYERERSRRALTLVIRQPDGTERIEKFSNQEALLERQLALPREREAEGWTGPHGWNLQPPISVLKNGLHVGGEGRARMIAGDQPTLTAEDASSAVSPMWPLAGSRLAAPRPLVVSDDRSAGAADRSLAGAIMLALRLVALALGAFRPFSQVFDLTSGPIVQGWVA